MKKEVLELMGDPDLFWTVARSYLVADFIEGRKILDVGCGNGIPSIKLTRLGYDVTGIDLLDSAISNARKNAETSGVNTKFMVGTVNSLKGKFDSIIMLDVLEHIKDDVGFLKKLKKNLVKGGAVILLVPAHQSLFGKWDEDHEHYRRYSMQALKLAVQKAGFKVEVMRYWSIVTIPPLFIFSRLLNRRLPVNAISGSFANRVLLRWALAIENKISMPTGASILIKASFNHR